MKPAAEEASGCGALANDSCIVPTPVTGGVIRNALFLEQQQPEIPEEKTVIKGIKLKVE